MKSVIQEEEEDCKFEKDAANTSLWESLQWSPHSREVAVEGVNGNITEGMLNIIFTKSSSRTLYYLTLVFRLIIYKVINILTDTHNPLV